MRLNSEQRQEMCRDIVDAIIDDNTISHILCIIARDSKDGIRMETLTTDALAALTVLDLSASHISKVVFPEMND